MEEVKAADPVGEVKGDPVEHDARNDLVDAQTGFQKAHKSGVKRRYQHSGYKDHKDCNGLGEVQHTADHGGDYAAHDVLSFRADIEKSGLDREGDAKSCENDRRRADHDTGNVLGSADHALDQRFD